MNRKKHIILAIFVLTVLLPCICAAGCRGANTGETPDTDIVKKTENVAVSIPCVDKKAGLYDISGRIISDNYGIICSAQMSGGRVLVASKNYDNSSVKVQVYSYTLDKMLGVVEELPIDMMHEIYVSRDNKIIVLGLDGDVDLDGETERGFSLKILIYDENLNKINTVVRENHGLYESYAINEEKNEIYIMSDGVAKLEIFSIATMRTEEKDYGVDAVNMSIRGYVPGTNHLVVQYDGGDGNLREGYIDMNTYKLKDSGFYANYGLYGNVLAEYENPNGNLNIFAWRDVAVPRKKNIIYLENKGMYFYEDVDRGGRCLFVHVYDKNGMLQSIDVYDLSACKMIGSISDGVIGDNMSVFIHDIDTEKSDAIVIIVSGGDTEKALLCNIAGMDYRDGKAAVDILENHAYDVLDKVTELEERYGISIKTGMEVIKMFPDFAVSHVSDNQLTMRALEEIEKVLARCPEGFFEQFAYGDIAGIELYLAGTLIQGFAYGVSSPGGFSCICDGKSAIIMDINYCDTLAVTFSHELSHAIDKKIEYMDITENGFNEFLKYDEEFFKLNPANYEYEYSYKVDGEDISSFNRPLYTPQDERAQDDLDIIYFANGYGTAFPTEDRSTIFENLLGLSEEDILPYYYGSINLRKKAGLMFKTIRETFNIPDGQELYWERWW